MRTALFILPLILISACNTKTVSPVATSGNINVSAPYLWASSAFPRNLKISDDFSNDEVANIQGMSTAWETAVEDKKNFFNNTDRTAEVSAPNMNLDSLGDDSVNGIYKITNWPLSLNSSALAVTQIFGRRFNIGGSDEYVRIEHADILINENLYNFRTGDTNPLDGSYDLRTVVLHEIGHFLGLAHKYGTTVMVPSVNTSSSNWAPKSVDITDITAKYHITLTAAPAGAAMAAPNKVYSPKAGDSGQQVKIMIELLADGECVHKENGVEIKRHSLRK